MTMQSDPLDFLKDVDVRLSVELGAAQMKLRSVMALRESSIVVLERLADELLDVMVNGQRIARGEVIIDGNRFGLRIVEMAGQTSASAMPPTSSPAGGFDESALYSSAAQASRDAG
jgi:flagellar motor switch protein FliN